MPPMTDNRHVYIVDDDDAVRDSLSVLLQASGYRVRSFGLAREFLDAAPNLPFGCLIVDIRTGQTYSSAAGSSTPAQH